MPKVNRETSFRNRVLEAQRVCEMNLNGDLEIIVFVDVEDGELHHVHLDVDGFIDDGVFDVGVWSDAMTAMLDGDSPRIFGVCCPLYDNTESYLGLLMMEAVCFSESMLTIRHRSVSNTFRKVGDWQSKRFLSVLRELAAPARPYVVYKG